MARKHIFEKDQELTAALDLLNSRLFLTRDNPLVSYYILRRLAQKGYASYVDAEEKKPRGRTPKVFMITEKGIKKIAETAPF